MTVCGVRRRDGEAWLVRQLSSIDKNTQSRQKQTWTDKQTRCRLKFVLVFEFCGGCLMSDSHDASIHFETERCSFCGIQHADAAAAGFITKSECHNFDQLCDRDAAGVRFWASYGMNYWAGVEQESQTLSAWRVHCLLCRTFIWSAAAHSTQRVHRSLYRSVQEINRLTITAF